jgi:hypothetical protein
MTPVFFLKYTSFWIQVNVTVIVSLTTHQKCFPIGFNNCLQSSGQQDSLEPLADIWKLTINPGFPPMTTVSDRWLPVSDVMQPWTLRQSAKATKMLKIAVRSQLPWDVPESERMSFVVCSTNPVQSSIKRVKKSHVILPRGFIPPHIRLRYPRISSTVIRAYPRTSQRVPEYRQTLTQNASWDFQSG